MRAASKGDMESVSALLAAGADVNGQDVFGHTALMFAAGEGHLEIVQILLSEGAEVNASNQVGATAFSRAGAIDKADPEGRFAHEEQLNQALLHAARDGDTAKIKNLIEAGCDVNARTGDGRSEER